MSPYQVLVIIMATLLVVGCAPVTTQLYDGDKLPNSDVSIVSQFYSIELGEEASGVIMGSQLILISVDGVPLGKTEGFGGVELLPGKHTFEYAINVVNWLPLGHVLRYSDTYELEVLLPRGKRGAPFLTNPSFKSKTKMCMFFSNIDEPYQFLKLNELPPNMNYPYQCGEKVFDFEDESQGWKTLN